MSAIQKLLTDHIDIWTAAETEKKSGRGRSSGNAGNVYGIKKLRELILELAVRGKLVPQDANDEPASELLKRIQAEKARLVAEGKIKSKSPLTPLLQRGGSTATAANSNSTSPPLVKGGPGGISLDEQPFELPRGWEWVRLPEIYYPISVSGNKLLSSEIKETGRFPVVDQGQRYIAGYTDNDELLISLPGPVVVFGDHTTERKLVDFNFVAGADGVKILRPLLQDDKFFWWQLVSLKLEGRGYSRHYKVLNESFYALPPLAEQHRIVAKVDELMALCDQLETQHSNAAEAHEKLVNHLLGTLTQSPASISPLCKRGAGGDLDWQRIAEHFDTLFTTEASIDALKQTLLQLAVMGKLVPQDPNDEPASELLKRIQAEKAKLVAEGKIKSKSPLTPILQRGGSKATAMAAISSTAAFESESTPPTLTSPTSPISPPLVKGGAGGISEDEMPVELPRGWEWVHLEDLMPEFQNGASSRGDSNGESVVVLRLADIKDRRISIAEPRELLISPNMIKKYRLAKGDVLIVRVNGSADLVGGFVLCDQDFDGIYCDHFIRMRISQDMFNPRFLTLLGASQLVRDRIKDLFVTTAGQKTVNQGHIGSLKLPLLSVAEQHRIVAKVDELMSLCDQLKSRLTEAKQLQQKLADVLVEQAVSQ